MLPDKELERSRYDRRASGLLSEPRSIGNGPNSTGLLTTGAMAVPLELRAPYVYYEQVLARYLADSEQTLEICSGTGLHSGALLTHTKGKVICSDISEQSLQVLKAIYEFAGARLSAEIADMEQLPFKDQVFDVVTCAGGLSYGEPNHVMKEIWRVLKPGGHFVCVDSLNENPIYRLNRWLHYLRGERTKSTLLRMPRIITIQAYTQHFSCVDVRFFGAIAWLSPALKALLGASRAANLVDQADKWVGVYRSAFKFVMVARKQV